MLPLLKFEQAGPSDPEKQASAKEQAESDGESESSEESSEEEEAAGGPDVPSSKKRRLEEHPAATAGRVPIPFLLDGRSPTR